MDTMTREDFIRDVKTDPYTAIVQRMYADAWAMGYEAARRDAERALQRPVDELRAESYSDLRNRAMREMFDKQQEAEAKMIVALAALGRDNPGLLKGPRY